MSDILFHREDYPFAILEEFGLTAQMILDLPESVHQDCKEVLFHLCFPLRLSNQMDIQDAMQNSV